MALVPYNGRDGWFLTLVMIDRNNQQAIREFELIAADPDEAIATGLVMTTQYQALTQCQIVGRYISQRYQENAVATPAVGEKQVKAIITVRLAGSTEKATLDVPAPVETMFNALTGDGNLVVDTTFAPLTTFVANFQAAGGNALISDGEVIDVILRGKKV